MKQTIVLGGGCFWCIEAVMQRVLGVIEVESGYAGGFVKNPSYEQVCSGSTGHAEVVRVSFDSDQVSLSDILKIFFSVHNPTTLNRQGADVGTQYRSIVLYCNSAQRETVESVIEEIERAGIWDDALVTERALLADFYPAELYHQDYYNQHQANGYCQAVIAPKVQAFRSSFSHLFVEQ